MEIKSPKIEKFATLALRIRSNGKSLWGKYRRTFKISNVEIRYGGFFDSEVHGPGGSLTIYGEPEKMPWDVYGDEGIEKTLLKELGSRFNIETLGWSEQGMQNDGIWNFDVRFHKDGFKVSNP